MSFIEHTCLTCLCLKHICMYYIYVSVKLGQKGFSKICHLIWIIPTHKPRLLGSPHLQIRQKNTSIQYKGIEQWRLNEHEERIR